VSTGPQRKPPSRVVQVCAFVFTILGVGIFQAAAPSLFPRPPGGGFDVKQVLAAGGIGAVCALVGAGAGTLIDRLRK
jgi:hypothetical protein